ncbi:hypothetical protein AB0M46_33340 [Dactylosporangium sp. NPDC051485]
MQSTEFVLDPTGYVTVSVYAAEPSDNSSDGVIGLVRDLGEHRA